MAFGCAFVVQNHCSCRRALDLLEDAAVLGVPGIGNKELGLGSQHLDRKNSGMDSAEARPYWVADGASTDRYAKHPSRCSDYPQLDPGGCVQCLQVAG